MVRIVIDNDIVAVPQPVIAEADVIRGNAEIEAAEPESVRTAAPEMPNVTATEAAGKAAVLPGMIEVVVRIIGAGVVANPLAVSVDVRCIGMAGLVVKVTGFLSGRGMRSVHWRWAMGGNVCRSTSNGPAMLGEHYNGKQKTDCKKSEEFFILILSSSAPGDCSGG